MNPDIAMCWDGETPEAELIVEEFSARGDPTAVQEMFNILCELRNRADEAERRLRNVLRAINEAVRR